MANKVILIGNLGSAVEVKKFEDGGQIGNVSLATSETYKNKDGEKVTNTEWHRLVFRNKQVDAAAKYLSKGDKLYVEGTIRYRQFQDKNGVTKYTTEIGVREFEFLTPKSDSKPNSDAPPSQEEPDDLPF